MPEVVNVRFRNRGKVYYFDPAGTSPAAGEQVVVETSKGTELGDCLEGVHEVSEDSVVQPLRPVVRIATPEDIALAEENRKKEKAAFDICQEKIERHGLDMKLVDVEYSFSGEKILFFFTSDGRVDFRELVKDLASVFHTRIQLMQIGVRDGAKMLGGLGICGRPFCCSSFLDEFQPVSIKMAKTQSLSLNPTKISGTCGRLMCCLKYEQDAYEHLLKTVPKVDTPVDTPQGKGTVTEVNLLRRTVKVKLDEGDQLPQPWSVDRLGYTIGGEYKAPEPEEASAEIKPAEPVWFAPSEEREASQDYAPEEKRRDRPRQPRQGGRPRHSQQRPPKNGGEAHAKPAQPQRTAAAVTEQQPPEQSAQHAHKDTQKNHFKKFKRYGAPKKPTDSGEPTQHE